MNIDIIIPFRHSRWDDMEIKYALRGVEKHLSGVGNVFIVGDYPKTISKGFIHIPYADELQRVYKERNIFNKVRHVLGQTTERVLFMNDDHFLTADYQAAEFPNYYGDWPVKSDMYKQTIENSRPYALRFYDVHAPIVFERDRFMEKVASLDWNVKAGYCMKSVYAKGLEGEYYKDLKIRVQYPLEQLREMAGSGAWFSMCDAARGPQMEELLNELYPEPSRFETANKLTFI
jgi:hypothetical protein